jgi:hypothetical protein
MTLCAMGAHDETPPFGPPASCESLERPHCARRPRSKYQVRAPPPDSGIAEAATGYLSSRGNPCRLFRRISIAVVHARAWQIPEDRVANCELYHCN